MKQGPGCVTTAIIHVIVLFTTGCADIAGMQVSLSGIGRSGRGAQTIASLSLVLTNVLSQPIVIPWALSIQNSNYLGELLTYSSV